MSILNSVMDWMTTAYSTMDGSTMTAFAEVTGTSKEGAQSFLDSEAGKSLQSIMGAFGVLAVIISLLFAANSWMKGKLGKGMIGLFGGILLAAFLFSPGSFIGIISSFSGVLDKVGISFDDVANGGGGGAPQ